MALLLTAASLSIGTLIFLTAQRQINQFYDTQLIIGANVLRALMADELSERRDPNAKHTLEVDDEPLLSPEDRQAFNNYASWRMFRLWDHGALALESDTGPPERRPPPHSGFRTLHSSDGHWRIYTLSQAKDGLVIEVGERLRIRHVLVHRVALEIALPLTMLIGAGIWLIWVSLANGLRVLSGLMLDVTRRTAHDLSEVDPKLWPVDLSPLIRSVNILFRRLRRAFEQERRFTDQAAHQLRTPLAVLKLHTQMLAREDNPDERRALIAKLEDSVDRSSALVESLLTLARLEGARLSEGVLDVASATAEVIADFAPAAAASGVGLSFKGESGAFIQGDSTLYGLIVANLLENAIRHAPSDTEVEVHLFSEPQCVGVQICDKGPGIPAADRAFVFERFYRGPNEAHHGAGLGLAIVTEALRVLGGTIALTNRPDHGPGLCATVRFPRPTE